MCTPTTRVFWSRTSVRAELVSDHAAAFDALYAPVVGSAAQDSTDSTFTSAPPPLAASTGANARVTRTGPQKLVSNSARAPARSAAPTREPAPDTPALLTTSVTSVSCSAAAATAAGSVTSRATGVSRGSVIEAGLRAAA